METRYSKIVAREIQQAEVAIYGEIGKDINGDYLAREINYLGKTADIIIIRINSLGGSLVQGLSIVGAIVASPAKTISIIEGIAGSMSGVIAMSCNRIKMNDFARIMLHNPYFADDNGDEIKKLSDADKEALRNFKGQISELLSRRGKNKKEIDGILKKDTWYKAEEALSAGFVDEIIDTGVDKGSVSGLTIEKLVAFSNNKFLPTNTDMKKIAAKLGLPETADEQAILTALDQKDTSLADSRKKLVDAVIAAGKKSGTINDTNVASMTKLGNTDIDLLVDLVIKPVEGNDNTRLSDVLAKVDAALEGIKNPDKDKDEKDWDHYQKNDPDALVVMKVKEPEKFKKIYKDFWGEEWDGK